MFLRVFLLLKCLREKFFRFLSCISYPFDNISEGQMKVGALYTKLIHLAAILQHKNIPLSLHGNGRKDQERKITEKEEKTTGRANEESL